eukprot:2454556-Rhodomonas_salina.2
MARIDRFSTLGRNHYHSPEVLYLISRIGGATSHQLCSAARGPSSYFAMAGRDEGGSAAGDGSAISGADSDERDLNREPSAGSSEHMIPRMSSSGTAGADNQFGRAWWRWKGGERLCSQSVFALCNGLTLSLSLCVPDGGVAVLVPNTEHSTANAARQPDKDERYAVSVSPPGPALRVRAH